MKYHDDRQGSKLLFLMILIVFIYLAFFNFNLKAAFDAAVQAQVGFFREIF